MSSALSSFVRRGSHAGLEKPAKYPLRRVEPLLRKYFKVFQINLDRMQQHKVNIQKVIVCFCIFGVCVCIFDIVCLYTWCLYNTSVFD